MVKSNRISDRGVNSRSLSLIPALSTKFPSCQLLCGEYNYNHRKTDKRFRLSVHKFLRLQLLVNDFIGFLTRTLGLFKKPRNRQISAGFISKRTARAKPSFQVAMASVLCGKTRPATASSAGWGWFFPLVSLPVPPAEPSLLSNDDGVSTTRSTTFGAWTTQAVVRYLTNLEQETLVSFVVTPYTMCWPHSQPPRAAGGGAFFWKKKGN